MKKIIQNIFSIKNSWDRKHKIITILGLKFKFKYKKNGRLKDSEKLDIIIDRVRYVEKMLAYCFPVESIPKNNGDLRLIQMSSVAIFSHFADIVSKYNLRWWLDSGTLIGYYRHKDVVPWDDDIDIAMIREDYEKLPEILEQEFTSDGFYYKVGEITRLYYKDIHVWVDIFPMDIGYSETPLTGDEYEDFVEKLNFIKSDMNWNEEKWRNHEVPVSQEYLDKAYMLRDTMLVKNKIEKGFIFYGVEMFVRNRILYRHSDIFPLEKVNFMGVESYIPNKGEFYLSLMYGDWRKWPKNFVALTQCHQDSFVNHLTADDRRICAELVEKYYRGE